MAGDSCLEEALGTVEVWVCRLEEVGSSEVWGGEPWAAGLLQSLQARGLPLVWATGLVVAVGEGRTSWVRGYWDDILKLQFL